MVFFFKRPFGIFPALFCFSQAQEEILVPLHSLWQVLPPFTTRKTVRHLKWKRTLWSLCGRDTGGRGSQHGSSVQVKRTCPPCSHPRCVTPRRSHRTSRRAGPGPATSCPAALPTLRPERRVFSLFSSAHSVVSRNREGPRADQTLSF